MSRGTRIVEVLKAVEAADAKLRQLVSWVEEQASRLLVIADEEARRIRSKAEQLVEQAIAELARAYEREARRIEEVYARRMEEEVKRLEEAARANRGRAIEEAARRLLEVVSGGASD
jgi:vacuolar-type H+-ATPase subunit H